MNPNKEQDQMWLIKTIWGFWKPALASNAVKDNGDTESHKMICKRFL